MLHSEGIGCFLALECGLAARKCTAYPMRRPRGLCWPKVGERRAGFGGGERPFWPNGGEWGGLVLGYVGGWGKEWRTGSEGLGKVMGGYACIR